MARDKFRSAMMRQYSASLRMLIRRDNAKYSSARVRKYCASCTPDSGSLRSSTWVSKTLLNCPCDLLWRGMRVGDAVPVNVRLLRSCRQTKRTQVRTVPYIGANLSRNSNPDRQLLPSSRRSGSSRSDSIRRPSPGTRATGPLRSSRACAMSRSFGLKRLNEGRSSLCVLRSSLVE